MDIRTAILKAADHIEANPGEFDFTATGIPKKILCGTPGCALGWIGHFAGHRNCGAGWGYGRVATEILLIPRQARIRKGGPSAWEADECGFYNRMDEVSGSGSWQRSSAECARALRLYADKYHPKKQVQQAPNWNAMAAKQTIGADEVSEELL